MHDNLINHKEVFVYEVPKLKDSLLLYFSRS